MLTSLRIFSRPQRAEAHAMDTTLMHTTRASSSRIRVRKRSFIFRFCSFPLLLLDFCCSSPMANLSMLRIASRIWRPAVRRKTRLLLTASVSAVSSKAVSVFSGPIS